MTDNTQYPNICSVNPDGSTNVDGFLARYAEDDNEFWATDTGHIMNVLDEVIGRMEHYHFALACIATGRVEHTCNGGGCPICIARDALNG